jgi:hypothetical protein
MLCIRQLTSSADIRNDVLFVTGLGTRKLRGYRARWDRSESRGQCRASEMRLWCGTESSITVNILYLSGSPGYLYISIADGGFFLAAVLVS